MTERIQTPGPATPDWLDDGLRHLWLPYTQMKTAPAPLPVVATEGVRLHLADGRRLIDGIASWWTACHGYNHPHIRACIREQLERMPHVMLGGLAHEPASRLAARLTALLPAPLERVFFSESGSVSVEIALKMALQHWIQRGQPQRSRFVSFLGGYHGDTVGAMSVCDPDEGMHSLFKSLLPAQHIVPLPRDDAGLAGFERFLDKEGPTCAALIIEPLVQGASGMRFHAPEILTQVVLRAREHGMLVIFDEIFTGFGRTGSLFALEQAGVVPDVITLSKSLSGGALPLAATIATDAVFDAFWSDDPDAALMHGPTFMANPLACAAGNASLDLFEREPRLEQARGLGEQMRKELAPCAGLPGVIDVRVRGAIGVVQLESLRDPAALRTRFVEQGVWIRPLGDVVYLTPSLMMAPEDLSALNDAIVRVLGS